MGTYTSLSDIDIAVLFDEGLSKETMGKLENDIIEELIRIFKIYEINLIVINSAPLSVR